MAYAFALRPKRTARMENNEIQAVVCVRDERVSSLLVRTEDVADSTRV